MLRSYTLALMLVIGAAPSCSDLPDVVEPKPAGAGNGAGKSGASGAAAGKGGSAGKDDNRDAGADEDASS